MLVVVGIVVIGLSVVVVGSSVVVVVLVVVVVVVVVELLVVVSGSMVAKNRLSIDYRLISHSWSHSPQSSSQESHDKEYEQA